MMGEALQISKMSICAGPERLRVEKSLLFLIFMIGPGFNNRLRE
jgi:hypothetical protein